MQLEKHFNNIKLNAMLHGKHIKRYKINIYIKESILISLNNEKINSSFILILIMCPKITQYELIYIELNRAHSEASLENYFSVKVSRTKDSIEYRFSSRFNYLEDAKQTFVNNRFNEPIKYKMNYNHCSIGSEMITDYNLKKYDIGDTINKCVYMALEEGFLVQSM